MTLSELNTIGKRLDKMKAAIEPPQEITIVCCWGDEELEGDYIEVKTQWGGGTLEEDSGE